ncbi:MAG: hypothetical protein AB7G75_07935 [Candidatus Binatia bacterium]
MATIEGLTLGVGEQDRALKALSGELRRKPRSITATELQEEASFGVSTRSE